MSSEAINSTTPATPVAEEQVFTIEGKEYKRSELNPKTFNSIVRRRGDLPPCPIIFACEFIITVPAIRNCILQIFDQ